MWALSSLMFCLALCPPAAHLVPRPGRNHIGQASGRPVRWFWSRIGTPLAVAT
jgi:hypothetical protein